MTADASNQMAASLIEPLKTEWESIAQAPVRTWEAAVAPMIAEFHRLRTEQRWESPEDLLSIIGRGRRELSHSAVLAWLLKPRASHGLGDGFLVDVLALAGAAPTPSAPPQKVRVQREVPGKFKNREVRADIVVSGRGFTLIIENKIDAEEHSGQIERLIGAFAHVSNPIFVFLTPDGRQPRTAGSRAATVRCLSYPDLREHLRERLALTTGGAGRSSAENYLMTLDKEFP